MGEHNVYNIKGEVVGSVEIDQQIEGYEPKPHVVHDVVVSYLANQRSGTACTKTRNEINASTKKPWRQKGTGRARIGTRTSPLWKGGGTVFGPKPRDYSKNISKELKRVALLSAVSDKLSSNSVIIVEKIEIKQPKTKDLINVLKNLGIIDKKLLVIGASSDLNLLRSARNIPAVKVVSCNDVNTYEILDCEKVIIEKSALEILRSRLIA